MNDGYWRGTMNWPLDKGWTCPICGHDWLIWGFQTGLCRCEKCHVEYSMIDKGRKTVRIPICLYDERTILWCAAYWRAIQTPLDEWTDQDWAEAKNPGQKEAHDQPKMF